MLRVAILSNYVSPEAGRTLVGGVESASSYLIDALRDIEELDIHVITCDQPTDTAVIERHQGVTLHRLPGSSRGQVLTRYRAVRRRVRAQLERIRPDVVHAQDLDKYALSLVGSRYRWVVTVHGLAREEARYVDGWRDRLRTRLRAQLISEPALRSTRHLIAISPYVRRYFPVLANRRVYDIPNAIDERYFGINDPGMPDHLLYAGRVIPRKRVRELIEVVGLVRRDRPNVVLRVAGDLSDSAYAASLQELIADRGLEDHVVFLGQLDEGSVLEEFRRCSALALCSGQETAPMVIAQAMAAGKPVVATAVGGVADMVEHGVSGFVAGIDEDDAFASHVFRVLSCPDEARRLGAAGKLKAERDYRASAVAARTMDAYFDVATAVRRLNQATINVGNTTSSRAEVSSTALSRRS